MSKQLSITFYFPSSFTEVGQQMQSDCQHGWIQLQKQCSSFSTSNVLLHITKKLNLLHPSVACNQWDALALVFAGEKPGCDSIAACCIWSNRCFITNCSIMRYFTFWQHLSHPPCPQFTITAKGSEVFSHTMCKFAAHFIKHFSKAQKERTTCSHEYQKDTNSMRLCKERKMSKGCVPTSTAKPFYTTPRPVARTNWGQLSSAEL